MGIWEAPGVTPQNFYRVNAGSSLYSVYRCGSDPKLIGKAENLEQAQNLIDKDSKIVQSPNMKHYVTVHYTPPGMSQKIHQTFQWNLDPNDIQGSAEKYAKICRGIIHKIKITPKLVK